MRRSNISAPSQCFEGMARALIEPAKVVGAASTPLGKEERGDKKEELQPRGRLDHPHMPLPEADPAAFYSSSGFFAHTPTKPLPAFCVQCGTLEAAVVCFSCSRFEGGGRGKYCKGCFEACHPFYRVRHKWMRLDDVDQHNYRATLERNITDIRGLLDSTLDWGSELDAQDTDTTVDDAIKQVARLDESLSVRIRDLKGLTCEDEDRTKVSAIAVRAIEASARKFQKSYEGREIDGTKAGDFGGKA